MAKRFLSLSVHQLVDALLRVGDIDDRVYNQETMRMGSLLHASFQRKQGNEYLSEVALEEAFERPDGTIALNGRADGIILGGDYPIIDEIKSTVMDLEAFYNEQKDWHLGQALCYAVMYLHRIGGNKVGVRLTYLSQGSSDKAEHNFVFSLEEAEKKVYGYIDDYLQMMEENFSHMESRDHSAESLKFPYPQFRVGQRELAKYVYGAIAKKQILFSEAPTGIGKTMSVLYPAIRSMKVGKIDKIFYFTAKATGALAASKAIGELIEAGWQGRDSWILSREKICPNKGHACNPDECPFASQYYVKSKYLIKEICKKEKRFDPETILGYCLSTVVCPFEFQLDLSERADVIIADYNYLIDPLVHFERYFEQGYDPKKFVTLIDEAHNLVERGRNCYSVDFSADEFRIAKKAMKGKEFATLRKALTKVETALQEAYPIQDGMTVLESPPEEILTAFESLKRSEANRAKSKKPHPRPPEEYGEVARKGARYTRLISDYYGSRYKVYATRHGDDASYHLLCVDPAPFLRESLSKSRASVVFSATLSPIEYYMKATIGEEDRPFLLLPSPFPKDNFRVILAPKVSVRYKDRKDTYAKVAAYLKAFVKAKQGNYFLFFPSYEYLDGISSLLDFDGCNVFPQTRSMTQDERNEFLSHFPPNPDSTNIGLLILGGSFSEGVDLADDRLIGVAVVGIGLPQIGDQNEIVRAFIEEEGGDGFAFAYKDPGMNKVMQAVGRVIRSMTDVGSALLIDDRYTRSEYRQEFLRKYREYEIALSPEDVETALQEFYGTHLS